jgi:RNA polymerase sigma-70 factor (ECF subfamily)
VDVSDADLISRSRSGDLTAFDALMGRYQGLVFTVARACVRDRDAALDVSQNTFLKAFKRLDSLRDEASFRPWIARIARHEGIIWARRNRHQCECMGFVDPDEMGLADAAPSPEAQMLSDERGSRLAEQLGRLNRRYRLTMSLRYVEGMSIAEIAAVLRCSEGMVKNMLFRSVRKLRHELTEGTRQVP